MKNYIFCCLTMVFLSSQLISQNNVQSIYFDLGKSTLNKPSITTLNLLLEEIKKTKTEVINISGFTDLSGDANSNLELSKKRASAVSDYFLSKGIDKKIINVQYFGQEKSLRSVDPRQNRRVLIKIGSNVNAKEQIFTGIFGKLWKKPVKHIFSASKVSSGEVLIVDGPEGTKVWIPSSGLIRANGEAPKGDVVVELTEYYKKSDILLANLHSASDSAMLETGGMINLVARSDGETLSIKKGSEISIMFQAKNKLPGMTVFLGTTHDKQMNWKQRSKYYSIGSVPIYRPNTESSYQGMYRGAIADSLLLTSTSLGWINCDRFREITSKSNLTVNIDTLYHAAVRLVFKDINAVMPAFEHGTNTYLIRNIPIGQKANLLAFGRVNNQPYFFSKEIVIGDNQSEKLTLKKTTMEELSTLLKKFN